ncbi:cytochrome c biogenesis protein CcsA [Sporomusa acidovorans]|uniref:Cytochrome c biogenesis protein CcsA n=1 Tax=Sporomusa acidovorans (strain ATCC 49682 / DSM 3132 / Mol) TaxID=1123286 RepID=A0ABZ3J1L2_SPOA4|nr:cytochrome c biogenesis protein CcsA [Sporomusa acidovorans]OZC23186.1 cytochrome c biogenesis protein CcsA [Sporomusa acidovorans DSM 3132]SDE97100.1 cytochrome c-type biogenesis protein CcsB [Sporomusa acidovorans]
MIKMAMLAAFYCTIILFFLSSIFYYIQVQSCGKIATSLAFAGLITNTIVLIFRVVLTGQGSFSNSVEFLVLLSWLCVLFYLIFEYKFKTRSAGFVMLSLAGFLVLFIAVVMPRGLIMVEFQPPVLKSIWLSAHVFTAVLAYGAFALAAAISASYLFYTRQSFKGLDVEKAVYSIIVFGFLTLTITIILGAIWAEQAWGSYWSWDPKEIWSLITWGVYALYFHFRNSKNWSEPLTARFAIIGFIIVLFTFFGVNFLMRGLHSYA